METSDNIAELAAALAKAQGVIEGAKKDADNPFFKSKYADLASVWEACRKPLTDNGLSVVQTSEFIGECDKVCIETMLCHSSGQWIRGRLVMKPVKGDPQSVGSCITYARRYSLQSMVGIAPEDDDGNAASQPSDKLPPQTRADTAPPVQRATGGQISTISPQDDATPVPEKKDLPFTGATPAQLRAIHAAFTERGIKDREIILALISERIKRQIESSKDLLKDEASDVIEWLQEKNTEEGYAHDGQSGQV